VLPLPLPDPPLDALPPSAPEPPAAGVGVPALPPVADQTAPAAPAALASSFRR
jgi:hypothetical protein